MFACTAVKQDAVLQLLQLVSFYFATHVQASLVCKCFQTNR